MRLTATQSLDRTLSALPLVQRTKMIEQMRDILFSYEMDAIIEESQSPEQTEIPFCRECGSVDTVRYGYSRGKQRYRCRDCGQTFTQYTPRSIIGTSKLSKATWMRYITCFVDGLTVKQCAEKCHISERTAYTMRLRLLSLIEQTQDAWRLRGGERAQIDETFTYESFKGNRTNCKDFDMPRPSYKRGRRTDKVHKLYGKTASDSICIVTGVNEYRQAFFEITSRAMVDSISCRNVLSDKLEKGSCVSTDDLATYVGVFNMLGVHHTSYNSQRSGGNLNGVNALHSHFKGFIAKKKGVSTRRLPLYLAEFSWRWSTCMNDDGNTTTARIVRKIAETEYTDKLTSFTQEPYPFIEWWDTAKGRKACEIMKLDILQHEIDEAYYEAAGDEGELEIVRQRQEARDARARAVHMEIDERKTARFNKPRKKRRATIGLLKTSPPTN